MADDENGNEIPDAQPAPDLSIAASTPLFYANVVRFYVGPYDLMMEFGHQHPEQLTSGHYSPVSRVAMSLAHAKTMIPLLARLIAEYETRFGVLPAPGFDQFAKE